jgi:hypothetical protein
MAEPFDEMAACRNAIDRMDQLLEDLRKYGFSLITALLTASGIAAGITHTGSVLPVAAATTMFLVIALFGIDMYYHVMLSAAVERSMDLEVASAPPGYSSHNHDQRQRHRNALRERGVRPLFHLARSCHRDWIHRRRHHGSYRASHPGDSDLGHDDRLLAFRPPRHQAPPDAAPSTPFHAHMRAGQHVGHHRKWIPAMENNGVLRYPRSRGRATN